MDRPQLLLRQAAPRLLAPLLLGIGLTLASGHDAPVEAASGAGVSVAEPPALQAEGDSTSPVELSPTRTPTRTRTPTPPGIPTALNQFVASGFRYQDPNYYACTSTTVMDVLNFLALNKLGGSGFRWQPTLSGATRDAILKWERTNDTLKGGNGSDPHGIRNALNYYGWGSATLWAGSRVYDDFAYGTYEGAIKSAVRAIVRHRKPVAILAWRGQHVQMVTGYYGLAGDPFERDADGRYTNRFTINGLYLSDPLSSQRLVNVRIGYGTLATTSNTRLRFRTYAETDSPYDDQYTPGTRPSRDEWYGRYVIVAPVR